MNRRRFLQAAVTTTYAGSTVSHSRAEDTKPKTSNGLPSHGKGLHERICLFTDLLDDFGYEYKEIASLLQQLKIAGPDLTVRPGGLVPPERVVEVLPKVAAIFRDHGQSIPMVSSSIVSATEAVARPTLITMGQLGIEYYKLGYFPYGDLEHWESRLEIVGKDLKGLMTLGAEAGIQAGFHNHAGSHVGGALWDLARLLEPLDPKWVGSYFDVAHATIEGGQHAWKLGFQRLASRITMIAIKDFVWEKTGNGWKTRWCPLGEGMVRWTEFFAMLAKQPFVGPVSLHIEYDPGGKTRAARLENCLAAAERDLNFLRKKLDEAYGTSH